MQEPGDDGAIERLLLADRKIQAVKQYRTAHADASLRDALAYVNGIEQRMRAAGSPLPLPARTGGRAFIAVGIAIIVAAIAVSVLVANLRH